MKRYLLLECHRQTAPPPPPSISLSLLTFLPSRKQKDIYGATISETEGCSNSGESHLADEFHQLALAARLGFPHLPREEASGEGGREGGREGGNKRKATKSCVCFVLESEG